MKNKTYNDISKIKVRLNVLRLVAFFIAYGIFGVAFFSFTRSYTCFLFMAVFLILPIISIMMLRYMLPYIDIMLFASENQTHVGSDIGIGIIVKNRSILTSLNCKCFLNIRNLFYGEEISQIFTIPLVAASDNKNPLYCKVSNCGIVETRLEKCEIYDLMGFVKAIVPLEQAVSVCVLPVYENLDDIQKLGVLSGFTDNEDDSQKGNEYSDTSNIREYIPGDRIKDIHWKLSAKRDILLVRDHIKSCENQLVLWIDFSPRKKFCEQILTLTYSIIQYCLKENTLVRLMWMEASDGQINEKMINRDRDVIDAFEKLFNSGKSTSAVDLRSMLLMNNYNYNKILRVGSDDGAVTFTTYEI